MLKEKNRSFAFQYRKTNPLKTLGVILIGLALSMVLGALVALQSSTVHAGEEANKNAIFQKVVKLRVSFIANQGQIKEEREAQPLVKPRRRRH